MHYRAIIICWLCVGSLSCCSVVDTDSCTQPPWKTQASLLKQSTHWVAQGSVALSSDQSHHLGHFRWTQDGEDLTIDITGPLQVPVATIEKPASQTLVRTADMDKPVPLSQWMQQHLGYPLPAYTLRAIMLGQPQSTRLSWRHHYPYQATHQHYRVTWKQYHCFPIGYRPQKILIELDNDKSLTLFIHDWYENDL
jgi:outer membrane biogenesis lipoprotein LolB